MSMSAPADQGYLHDQRVTRIAKFGAFLLLIAFTFWSIDVLNIPVERMLGMFGPLGSMVSERLMPPDLAYAMEPKILASIIETIEMRSEEHTSELQSLMRISYSVF